MNKFGDFNVFWRRFQYVAVVILSLVVFAILIINEQVINNAINTHKDLVQENKSLIIENEQLKMDLEDYDRLIVDHIDYSCCEHIEKLYHEMYEEDQEEGE